MSGEGGGLGQSREEFESESLFPVLGIGCADVEAPSRSASSRKLCRSPGVRRRQRCLTSRGEAKSFLARAGPHAGPPPVISRSATPSDPPSGPNPLYGSHPLCARGLPPFLLFRSGGEIASVPAQKFLSSLALLTDQPGSSGAQRRLHGRVRTGAGNASPRSSTVSSRSVFSVRSLQ
ncbi:hypothetical protein NDU88_005833 [Pleurodeles waltl]|uniref:Uncharacterized protein n=1 Tax=Pleurodeles waltl TaxID=8319 RepID=A0AAV7UJ70_PLEWA|nr:hypothetical protein NDU88_005833 [Pleurodeles waltl]